VKPTQRQVFLFIHFLFLSGTFAFSADISSNSTGGGLWSDPMTWHGKVVPTSGDDVIIQKNDIVAFDRNDAGKVSCRKLHIDPKGIFTFKTGGGTQICSIAEPIENFGIIRIDGTKSSSDFLELRMIGETPEKRGIKLKKGANLLLYGKPDLPDGKRNIALSSLNGAQQPDELINLIEAEGAVSIDIQWAALKNIRFIVSKIDNTGATPNEKINFIENRFSGLSSLSILYCDTPVLSKNTFEHLGPKLIEEPAIHVAYSPLSEIKGNHIRGGYITGISAGFQSDTTLSGNLIENCTNGIIIGGGAVAVPNSMIKKCVLRNCTNGIKILSGTGVLEDIIIEKSTQAFNANTSNLQLTNFQVTNLAPKGIAIALHTGSLTLLNCDIIPAQITLGPQPATAKVDSITALQYAVIACKGAPADSFIEVRTIVPALPADSADPNVRNSPAPLVNGLTPLANTLNPLIIKAWSIDVGGKLQAAPQYQVKLLGVALKEGEAKPVLKSINFKPIENAFRRESDESTVTLEVPLK